VLPFACRGDAGTVEVHYGVTSDPAALGFDLAAADFDNAGSPLPVAPAGPQRWDAHRPMLANAYPSWTFLASTW
jgi:hypothetical protein